MRTSAARRHARTGPAPEAPFARDHHKPLAIPEWSIERGQYGYCDNPDVNRDLY